MGSHFQLGIEVASAELKKKSGYFLPQKGEKKIH